MVEHFQLTQINGIKSMLMTIIPVMMNGNNTSPFTLKMKFHHYIIVVMSLINVIRKIKKEKKRKGKLFQLH